MQPLLEKSQNLNQKDTPIGHIHEESSEKCVTNYWHFKHIKISKSQSFQTHCNINVCLQLLNHIDIQP